MFLCIGAEKIPFDSVALFKYLFYILLDYLVAPLAPAQQLDTCPLISTPYPVLVPLYQPSVEQARALLPINLAAVDATHLVRILTRAHEQLLVDCGTLPCQRTLGICFLVSQLLVLRQSGATVWLRNASPALRRCLQKLKLSSIFLMAE